MLGTVFIKSGGRWGLRWWPFYTIVSNYYKIDYSEVVILF